MEINEWSDEFDVLYNNITSNQATGLTEYDKSIFITEALEEIVFNWFNPQGNKYLEGFDDSIKRLMDFSELVVTASSVVTNNPDSIPRANFNVVNEEDFTTVYTGNAGSVYYWEAESIFVWGVPLGNLLNLYNYWNNNTPLTLYRDPSFTLNELNNSQKFYPGVYYDLYTLSYVEVTNSGSVNTNVLPLVQQARYGSSTLDGRAVTYLLPSTSMLILNETLTVSRRGSTLILLGIPITFDEYTRLMSKPYPQPLKRLFWRLLSKGNNLYLPMVEIIPHSGDTILSYTVRYVKRPRPIILEDLSANYGSNVSINGETKPFKGELNPIADRVILKRAVVLAKNAFYGNLESDIALEQRSE